MNRQRRTHYCTASWCNNFAGCRTDKPVSLFRFPKDKERCAQWVKFSLREDLMHKAPYDLQNKFLCSEHFVESDFKTLYPRRTLRQFACPSVVEQGLSSNVVRQDELLRVSAPDKERDGNPISTREISMLNIYLEDDPGTHDDEFIKLSPACSAESLWSPVPLQDSPRNEKTSFVVQSERPYPSKSNDALDSHIGCANIDHNYVVSTELRGSQLKGSATIDHDYVVSTKLRESQLKECPGKSHENLSSRHVLGDVRIKLCRLCGQKGSLLAPIFAMPSNTCKDVTLSSKIEMHLPFKIKMEDPLPSHICLKCCEILNHWHELYVTCVAANAVLWKTFGGEYNESTSSDMDDAITRLKEGVQQKEPDINGEVKAEIEQMPAEPHISEKTEEKADKICVVCRKRNAEMKTTEDKEHDEMFATNFVVRNSSLKCKYCYELFMNSNDRKNHFSMCRQLSTLCDMCGHVIPCRKDLSQHIYVKHSRNITHYPFHCDICDKRLKSASSLYIHMKKCHEVQNTNPKYYCELCCSVFVKESSFKTHQKKHAEGKIKSVFQIKAFHQGENSQDSEISVHSCPVCQEVFNDKLSLMVHLTTQKKMKCTLCNKVMSCEKRFLFHVCGQWTCQFCLKTFTNKQKWVLHERLHTGERPLKCRICDKTFRTWLGRKSHENSHNPAYECSYCGKKFRTKDVFQDHVSGHEGKEFLCCICNKEFSARRYLLKHTSTIHKTVKESSY